MRESCNSLVHSFYDIKFMFVKLFVLMNLSVRGG